jgi:3-hydroxyisobutyrate dehydrogenase
MSGTQINSHELCILGLGHMGSALAKVLVQTRPVRVWNRTPHRIAPLIGLGADPAANASEAISASSFILISLIDNDAVMDVLGNEASLQARTVVNLTNGTPDEARGLAEHVQSKGGHYVHGAVMTVPALIGTP